MLVLKAVSQPGWIRDAQKHDYHSSSQFSPRPRWLPQAVYCACAEGRITARMDSNGFGIAITARHGFGGDAQKHDWGKMSKEVSSSQFSARTETLKNTIGCSVGG